jgi:hypothetical protein
VSAANKHKFESEKLFALKQKALGYVVPPKPQAPPKRTANIFAELAGGPLSTSKSTAASSSGASTQDELCACGEVRCPGEPWHKGYCGKCFVTLKAKFDTLVQKFEKIKTEYDKFNSRDTAAAQEKMKKLKRKME